MLIETTHEIESPLSGISIGDTFYLNEFPTTPIPKFFKHIPFIREMFYKKVLVDGFFSRTFFRFETNSKYNWKRDADFHGGGMYGTVTVLNKLDGKEYNINHMLMKYGNGLKEPIKIKEVSSVVVDGEKQIQRTIHNPERGLVFTKEYGEFLRDRFSLNIRWNAHWEPAAVIVDGGYINIQNF